MGMSLGQFLHVSIPNVLRVFHTNESYTQSAALALPDFISQICTRR